MRHDRLWQLGGAFCALVIVAFGYFFFIRPKDNDTATVRSDIDQAGLEVDRLRSSMAELSKQLQHLGEYQDTLARNQAALPSSDSVAALLRELQTAGELSGVTVSGVTVGTAQDLKATAGVDVYALPVSLDVTGPTAKMNPFLDQLQKVQPRALLISSVNFAASGTANNGLSLVTINLQAFYASAT